MKIKNAIRVGAAAILLGVTGASVAGTGHQWGDYHWEYAGQSSGDLQLRVSYKFADPIWNQYHQYSLDLWENNNQSMLDLIDRGENSRAKTRRCPAISGEIMVCSDRYGNVGWVGIAEIQVSGTHITQAVVKYNDTYYADPFYDNDEQRKFVTCHEIGHTFGLGHLDVTFDNPNLDSCMDYTSDPAGDSGLGPADNRDPGQVDWDVLNSSTAYGHGHEGGGGGGGEDPDPRPCRGGPKKCGNGAFAFREVGAPSADWEGPYGRAIGYDGKGRPNEFVQELGGGKRKFTFITWARGHRPAGSINK